MGSALQLLKTATAAETLQPRPDRYLLQVDVVQVIAGAHWLHHPALRSVQVQGEERGLGHVQELGHGAWRETAVGLEGHLRLQNVTVETADGERRSTAQWTHELKSGASPSQNRLGRLMFISMCAGSSLTLPSNPASFKLNSYSDPIVSLTNVHHLPQ